MGVAELLLLAYLSGARVPAFQPYVSQPDTTAPQLIALLQLRRENLPHDLRGEIYPAALFEDGAFRDARTAGVHPFTGDREAALPAGPSPLATIRDFTVYHEAAPIGRFRVTDVESAVYSCRAVQIGTGEMELPDRYVRFGRLDPRVHSFAISGVGFAYEYTLNYYVALSRPVQQPDFAWNSAADPAAVERLGLAILAAGSEALAGMAAGPGTGGATRARLREELRLFDLDRDGRPEAVGVIELVASPELESPGASDAPPAASVTIWAADRGESHEPRILTALRGSDSAGRNAFRRYLAEVMDVTGDGTAEIIYQIDGFEDHAIAILSLRKDALIEVFAGAEHGC